MDVFRIKILSYLSLFLVFSTFSYLPAHGGCEKEKKLETISRMALSSCDAALCFAGGVLASMDDETMRRAGCCAGALGSTFGLVNSLLFDFSPSGEVKPLKLFSDGFRVFSHLSMIESDKGKKKNKILPWVSAIPRGLALAADWVWLLKKDEAKSDAQKQAGKVLKVASTACRSTADGISGNNPMTTLSGIGSVATEVYSEFNDETIDYEMNTGRPEDDVSSGEHVTEPEPVVKRDRGELQNWFIYQVSYEADIREELKDFEGFVFDEDEDGDLTCDDCCSICCGDKGNGFIRSDMTMCSLCSSLYHKKCITQWIDTGQETCPNCRGYLVELSENDRKTRRAIAQAQGNNPDCVCFGELFE